MLSESYGVLSIYSDKFIKKCIDTYLSKTESGEFVNQSFTKLINSIFLDNDRKTLAEAFKEFDISLIEDILWMKAANTLINDKEYLTYSNTGAKYYNLLLTDFVDKNKMVMINEFIIKFCKERRIREKVIKEALLTPKIYDAIVGSILIEALKKEKELIKEEEMNAEVMFQVRSKEKYTQMLPKLPEGQTYFIKLDEGNGIAYIDENNVFNYTPPTVATNTFVKAKIYVVNDNGITIRTNPFKIEILPQKYLRPIFNTYKLKPGSTMSVQLEPVEDIYTYRATVDKGFGKLEIDDKFTLIYQAPDTRVAQNIAVKLELIWNDSIKLYESIINFNVILGDGEVDIAENVSSIGLLRQQVESVIDELKEVGNKVDNVESRVNKINTISNPDEFEVLE